MTTIAYRIEHSKDGKGFYNTKHGSIKTLHFYHLFTNNFISFNNPFDDGIDIKDNEYCAFKSIDQIKQFFQYIWLQQLIKMGYKLLEIELSLCLQGNHQIVFDKKYIVSTKELDINTIYQ